MTLNLLGGAMELVEGQEVEFALQRTQEDLTGSVHGRITLVRTPEHVPFPPLLNVSFHCFLKIPQRSLWNLPLNLLLQLSRPSPRRRSLLRSHAKEPQRLAHAALRKPQEALLAALHEGARVLLDDGTLQLSVSSRLDPASVRWYLSNPEKATGCVR